MAELDARIPRGTGTGAIAKRALLEPVLALGARAAVDAGYGTDTDLARCEERGVSIGADPDSVSNRARERGERQLGSLVAARRWRRVRVDGQPAVGQFQAGRAVGNLLAAQPGKDRVAVRLRKSIFKRPISI